MVQAIDRLRLIHNEKRKAVYILCSFPFDMPIDERVTWKQLTETDAGATRRRSVMRGGGTRCHWRPRR